MSLARVRWIAVILLIVVIALLVALCDRQPADRVTPEGAVDEELGPGVQSVVLFFADRGATGMVEERREIVVGEDRASRAKRILEELARGPHEGGGVRTIPAATSINSVFFDDAGGAYVDFSREFLVNHPGGSTVPYLETTLEQRSAPLVVLGANLRRVPEEIIPLRTVR